MFIRDYALNNIYIKGEVSNCKYHTSGHIYFTLNDDKGQMACVMFAGQRNGLKFLLKEGQSVIVLGSISVYERDGKYQLYAKEILLDGSGLLYQKYEELKKKLEEEGLFDQAHKKQIPLYPKKVGIVTASTGAAIQDIINIAARRNPYVQLILYPSKVQGEGAAESVVQGIKKLDSMELDTIIIGRGGGSIEDLWAFNEEIVARAVYNCNTPVISAVGHETDITIADFVSDLRAPTPSAAAELAIGDFRTLAADIEKYNKTLNLCISKKITGWRNDLKQLAMKLEYSSPKYQINQKRQLLSDAEQRLIVLIHNKLNDKKHQMELYIEKLEGLSPLRKLSKGYSMVLNSQGKVLNSIDKVKIGEKIQICVTDGDVTAQVDNVTRKERG
jgi:exodeoxyribonuclease VII large subunit